MAARPDYSSPSDLAEYAYCPRARYYRQRLGPPPPTPSTLSGVDFHARVLRATRRREQRRGWYAAVAIGGAALVLLGAALLLGA